MKLLHTSDWHLGATLHGASREEEHRRFLSWLLELMIAESVDALLVAGDLYHHAQPSAAAQRLLFDFLASCRQRAPELRIVLVGGNHDSASRLDATRALLDHAGIRIVGGMADDWKERALVPLKRADGTVGAVIAAVPYLHEHRLGVTAIGQDSGSYGSALNDAFRAVYDELAEAADTRWPGVPRIATGHLTCVGARAEDYDTPLHVVGGETGLSPSIFSDAWSYVALGHIHRPFPVEGDRVRYAGSPLPLRASEIGYAHQVRLVEIDAEGHARSRAVEVPLTRQLLCCAGSPDELIAELNAFRSDTDLPAYVIAQAILREPDPGCDERLHEALSQSAELQLVHLTLRSAAEVRAETVEQLLQCDVATASPEEVFRLLYQARYPEQEIAPELLDAFREATRRAQEEPA